MPKSPSRTSKKKKYNARFPPARIKKIMQTDEDVGKVAAAVPVIISRALELFIESLIKETSRTTLSKNAKTLSTFHIKHTIEGNKQFDFLRDLVANVPDHQTEDNNGDAGHHEGEYSSKKGRGGRPRKPKDPSDRLKKGESSKASSDASDDEDEEDDEDTETDEESSLASASMSYTTSGPAAPHNAFNNSQNILSSSSAPSSSTTVPRIHVTPPHSVPPSLPPTFTNPGMASLHNQQQQLQPYQQFHQQQQTQQHAHYSHPDNTSDPAPSYYPAFISGPAQRISAYPLPPQFANSYPPMPPPASRSPTSSYPQAQQQGLDGYSDPQHRNQHFHSQSVPHHEQVPQPVNLSHSSPRMSSSGQHSNDDYDT